MAITELLRWVFQEIYIQNEFNEVMGTILEMFILELLEENFNNLTIIPEQTYNKKSAHYRGPDITLVEDDKLLTIEIKSKHITLKTRLSQDSESLIKDLSSSINALIRLKDEKIPDLYSGFDVYKDFQDKINRTKDNKPLCIVVIGEGVYSLQEYLFMYSKKDKTFFLNTFDYPVCVIDVIHFCKALDVSITNNISLYSIFYKYWEVGNNLNQKRYSAEEFEGKEINWNDSVLSKYWNEIFNYAKDRLPK